MQGSEFGLEAMAEVVVERPETIFIGTANQVAKGVEHVWRYKLNFVGAERMYVCMEPPSTTHAGDLMFIMEEVVEGNKWYVAYFGKLLDLATYKFRVSGLISYVSCFRSG